MWAEYHVDRLPRRRMASRQTPRWTDSQVDRTERQQNQHLTEQVVDRILCGQNIMWEDSREDRFQVDKHPDAQTLK